MPASADRPEGMRIAMHLCRGNFRSSFVASGGYEPVADALFNRLDVDVYFMEWDNERAGGFEPLRFLPEGKTAVLGLVTSKTGTMETKDALKRRIEEEPRRHAPLERLALRPAMRLRLDRRRQPHRRGRAVAQAGAGVWKRHGRCGADGTGIRGHPRAPGSSTPSARARAIT